MKTGNIKTTVWLLLCSAILLFSCDRDYDKNDSKHYLLTVKAIDPDSENVKDNVSLYFFNQDRKLTQVATGSLDQQADVEAPYNKKYTVIAIAHSAEMQLPSIALGTTMADAQIILNESSFANKTVADSPGDIFYGSIDLEDGCGSVKEVIWVRRKVAALTIITRNIQDQLNTTDQDFSYLVRQTYGTLDFEGKFKGNKVNYHPKSYISTTNKDLVASKFYTYPSQADDGFSIDIYKGETLINTYSTDKDESSLLLKEGKHTVVIIDYKDNGGQGFLDVTLKLQDWSDDNINEGFN